MKTAYLDCFSGVSGDMLLGALLDAGLAEAEASVHGVTADRIHFHEVGAVDAIIDIVGTVAGLHHLGIDRLICSPLPMPRGWANCAHGEIPLPAPAVCRLLQGVPVYGEAIERELVTPTGAALVRELAEDFGPLPPMILEGTGLGAGSMQRPDGRPNLLRLLVGQSVEVTEAQEVEVIETHLDDWNPEYWPHVSERLMTAGALDVSLVPIQMKKGRPGFLLRVIADPAATMPLTTVLFSETSAIGLRRRREQRLTLPREQVNVATPWGDLPGKRIRTPAGEVITPEYEACRAMALAQGIPLDVVYTAVREGGKNLTRTP